MSALPLPHFCTYVDPDLINFVDHCFVHGPADVTRKQYVSTLLAYWTFCTMHGMVDHNGDAPFPLEMEMIFFAGWRKANRPSVSAC